jgi:RHS repeat-associated protein
MPLQRLNSRVCRKKYKTHSQAQRVFKTAPLYAVTNPEEAAPQDIWTTFTTFFESLWSPSTNPDGTTVQKAGMSYVYDEDGTLIAQTLTGGAQSSWGQSARYVYLPTANGPMPVAAIYGTKHYAIQSDHLNTPRRLIQSDGQVAWQWAYSAFGEEKPTIAKNRFANTDLNQSFGTTTVPAVTFNLRYPGQYFDQESNLHYNYHRSYSATTGRYTQADPIGLDGGWNRFGYVGGNPLNSTDSTGLFQDSDVLPAWQNYCSGSQMPWFARFDSINWGDLNKKVEKYISTKAGGGCVKQSIPVDEDFAVQAQGADKYIINRHIVRLTGSIDIDCDCSWKFDGWNQSKLGHDPYDFDPSNRGFEGELLSFIGRNRCPIDGAMFKIYITGEKRVKLEGKINGAQSCNQCPIK